MDQPTDITPAPTTSVGPRRPRGHASPPARCSACDTIGRQLVRAKPVPASTFRLLCPVCAARAAYNNPEFVHGGIISAAHIDRANRRHGWLRTTARSA